MQVIIGKIPEEMLEEVETRRLELIERLSEVDDEIADLFLNEAVISPEILSAAIRRATLALKFQPVFMGSAFKNKGRWNLPCCCPRFSSCSQRPVNTTTPERKVENITRTSIALSWNSVGSLMIYL